ncbi:hypothetical protein EVAR_8330_1 [Eumeta japonica]|uniref:Uncharacterized protein n=1 Tax=Eumeta variegata TaxID=151549 RepID=A0A4C1VE32_EUMVA|nr:hypothetical protein EVAR_8330_1 [Eumeta japonica]
MRREEIFYLAAGRPPAAPAGPRPHPRRPLGPNSIFVPRVRRCRAYVTRRVCKDFKIIRDIWRAAISPALVPASLRSHCPRRRDTISLTAAIRRLLCERLRNAIRASRTAPAGRPTHPFGCRATGGFAPSPSALNNGSLAAVGRVTRYFYYMFTDETTAHR